MLLHLFGNDFGNRTEISLKGSKHKKEKSKGLSDNMVKNNVICQ